MGLPQLGPMHAASFAADPKHLGFVLARYKFVAKMLVGAGRVLEIGCGDGTGAQVVRPAVGHLIGIDRDRGTAGEQWDILRGPYDGAPDLDGVYALDVLEHIQPHQEARAIGNMVAHLKIHGTCIVGMPSLESQPYASSLSRQHHVNCKTEDGLRATMREHFHSVYLFGMNDETIHTGFGPLCHYRLAICTGKRS